MSMWLYVTLYDDWSTKNHGQVYACKLYLELHVLVSLSYFKYFSHAKFKLLVPVNPSHLHRIGQGVLALVIMREHWAREQQ